MGSTFLKRYEHSRENFFNKTKQYPQLKTSTTGKQKSSGIAEDLQELDALLDSPKMDAAKLAQIFARFEKHARVYGQEISNDPGKGILDWMNKSSPVTDDAKKLIKKQSQEFATNIKTLIDDIDAVVKNEMEKVKSRSQVNAVLKAVQDEVGGWNKYTELQGIKIVSDAKFSRILLNPNTNQPAQDLANGPNQNQATTKEWLSYIAQIKKVDTSTILSSSTKKSITAMLHILEEMEHLAQTFSSACHTWNQEYNALTRLNQDTLKTAPDTAKQAAFDKANAAIGQLSTTVDTSKRRFNENVVTKITSFRKSLESLSP